MCFLDIEAEVDQDEEDEDEDEGIADFMVDEDDTAYGSHFSHQALNSQLRNRGDDALSDKADKIYDRILTSNRADRADAHEQDDPTPVPLLYLLRCAPKKELEVVFYAMGYCCENRVFGTILSIHYRKKGDGYLFLETPNPLEAARILGKCVFVLHSADSWYGKVALRRLETVRETILSLSLSPETIERGTWVCLSNPKFGLQKPSHDHKPPPKTPRSKITPQNELPTSEVTWLDELPTSDPHNYTPPRPKKLHRSLYHNDLALVLDVPFTPQQTPTVLVVLRYDERMKKIGIKSPLRLNEGTPLLLTQETVPDFDTLGLVDLNVASGLLVWSVERRNMILIWGPPSSHELILFATSDHPLVAEKFPAVRQWSFHEGESVSPWVGKWEGRITTLTNRGVEAVRTRHVNHGNKKTKTEEVRFLGWSINKVWRVGQYIQNYTGAEGFILACENNEVFFWKGGEEMGATPYVAHRNLLREVQKTRGINHILERRRDNVLAEVEKLAGVS
ncbi:hypothetical protein PM082_007192 [Marasmius tenuissimus]|nr:hypothetical protein PM082_007192 [Marasmius tenuissimus]